MPLFSDRDRDADGLSGFMDEFVPHQNQSGLYLGNTSGNRMLNLIGNEKATEATLATLFWQIILHESPYQWNQLDFIKPNQRPVRITEDFQVVSHGDGQFSLLCFVPEKIKVSKQSIREILKPEEAIELTRRWKKSFRYQSRSIYPEILSSAPRNYELMIDAIDDFFVHDILFHTDQSVVYCTRPKTALNVCALSGNPSGVSLSLGGPVVGTAGVYATDRQGRHGVTLAFHVVEPLIKTGVSPPIVYIDNVPAEIVSCDMISDSCFAVFTDHDHIHLALLDQIAGPLSGTSPRSYQQTFFNGANSGYKKTMITAWSPQLPMIHPRLQLTVQTDRDANPADSGAALVEDYQGKKTVIGFNLLSTALGEKPSFSTWIWAESVFVANHLL